MSEQKHHFVLENRNYIKNALGVSRKLNVLAQKRVHPSLLFKDNRDLFVRY